MKIGFLITASLDRPAGVRYANIARGLVALGHQVTIIALHPNFVQCTQRRFRWHGVDVHYVGQMHARKVGDRPTRFGPLALLRVVVQSTAAMTAAAMQMDVDCYHLGKPQPINGMVGMIASRIRKLPLYLDCDDYEAGSNRFSFAWQRQVFAWWEDHLPGQAQGVTVNTHFLAERVRRCGAEHVVRVPNGINLDHFKPLPARQRNALRQNLRLNESKVVGYIGSLSLNNHPVDLLLQAFAQIPDRDAKLLIVGSGEDAFRLHELSVQLDLGDRVRFTGHVPLSAVPSFTSLCDVTVDPVHDDDTARARCPLKVLESMALGIPVVTGDVGDRRELLNDGKAGMLVAPGAADALTRGLKRLLEDDQQRLAQGQVAHACAAQYDWLTLAQKWQTVYASSNMHPS